VPLTGKRIVIIGGSSGIGLAVAAAAAGEGAEIFIGSSQAAKIEEAKRQLEGRAAGAVVDVNNETSFADFFKLAGAFDHLVYTAGDALDRNPRPITDVQVEQLNRMLSVRLVGALLSVKHGYPYIREGGSIVLTSGIVAHRPRKGVPLGATMGGAVEHLAYALAVDLAPIRVNAVCPGGVATEAAGGNAGPLSDTLPIRGMAMPAEVAEAYLYAMKGGYTTGQVLRVDGGRSLI